MVKSLCILGGHIQALGLARQAKLKRVQVSLIVPDGFSVARFSKCVDKTYICKNEDELELCLKKCQGKDTMLFPTSDDYIDYIVRNYDSLKELFTIALPEFSAVKLFADKIRTYRFAEENDIPHPWSRYPQNLSDVEAMAEQFDYPVVVKPAVMYDFHKKFGKKAFLCENKESLMSKTKEIVAGDYPISGMIIQEYLAGGPKNLYSFGFFAVNGEVKSSIVVNRIRQNPMDFGNSTTFAVTVDVPEIEELSRRIVKDTNYTGMGEAEFMYEKGEYKFLEINTRAWKWHAITNGNGFSFIGDWIDWLNTGKLPQRQEKVGTMAWVERLTDFAVILKGVFRGQVSFKDAVRSYRHKKVSAVWSLRDPLPAIMYVLMSPILFVKRY